MFACKLYQVLFLLIVNGCYCQRRIKDGELVKDEKKYMVYLVKAPVSPQNYDGWLCGGALVSKEYIVTSAACVTDVIHLYAIAGYNKYVSDTELNKDECTKTRKKKVVLICTPQAYELKYEQVEKWSYIDIAVVKVESPYNFFDTTYDTLCSYTPQAITINYEAKYQEPKVDAIVFGWGHKKQWRDVNDPTDLNQEKMLYAPTLIQDKEECKKEYAVYKGMDQIIDNYMICTLDKGNINDAGLTIIKAEPTAEGCVTKLQKLRGSETLYCENADNPGEEIALIETRKDNNLVNETIHSLNQTYRRSLNDITNVDPKVSQDVDKKNENEKKYNQKISYLSNDIYRNVLGSNTTLNHTWDHKDNRRFSEGLRTRRNGICQNDHGGPLVTWVGSHEVLIGVASVFKITESRECVGPYLFTSTQCNGAFLDCIIKSDESKTDVIRRAICDAELGFKLVETQISWLDHPDGPAENEKNSSASNVTYHATIDLKFEKQQPIDIHTVSNISFPSNNQTSTNQVLNKTDPSNNAIQRLNTTDNNLADISPTNVTVKNDSTILTNFALKLLTNVTTIKNLTDLSSELNKAASRLELKSASTTSSNLTSTTPSSAINITSADFRQSTPGYTTIKNVNSSIYFNSSKAANAVTAAVSADLSNTTISNTTTSNTTTINTTISNTTISNTTTSKPTSRSVTS